MAFSHQDNKYKTPSPRSHADLFSKPSPTDDKVKMVTPFAKQQLAAAARMEAAKKQARQLEVHLRSFLHFETTQVAEKAKKDKAYKRTFCNSASCLPLKYMLSLRPRRLKRSLERIRCKNYFIDNLLF